MSLESLTADVHTLTSTSLSPLGYRPESSREGARVRHVGLVLKRTNAKGDPWSPEASGGDALEHACTQAIRGLNGFLSFAARNPEVAGRHRSLTVLPVVVTTAKLYSSRLSLAHSNLETGSASSQDPEMAPVDWIIYYYPQGYGLKHDLALTGLGRETDPLLESFCREYVRPVAVVSPSGLESFLRLHHWL
jgi:hypothetical protein